MTSAPQELHQLAELHNVQLGYIDINGHRRSASPESLLQILRCMDVPIDHVDQSLEVLRQGRLAAARRMIEPVVVAWEGTESGFGVRVPAGSGHGSIDCRLTLENGEQTAWSQSREGLVDCRERDCDGYRYVEGRVRLPAALPVGYHRLDVAHGDRSAHSLVLSAPAVAYTGADAAGRSWGVFLPLYALHRRASWGAGDFGDLEALNDWVARRGGKLVATLPLLASFHEKPGDESPYRPVSRLFWNEFFIDVAQVPEMRSSANLQALLQSPECLEEQRVLRQADIVDYRRQMALKQRLLEPMARQLFEGDSARRRALEQFARQVPDVELYAKFRGACALHRQSWTEWPERMRSGELRLGDYEEQAYRYHLYVQFVVAEQLARISSQAQQRNLTWYLDLPLGVHPDGFDVWRYRDAFAHGVSGGAPPDNFFTRGQFWDFLPLHPQRIREQGYGYVLAVLRAHLGYAKLLRIDHVMGLHRLYWVPFGVEARDGVYVRYAADELYAVLAIESQRSRARIIGEDLGTVPPEVGEAMDRHRVGRLFVTQYECRADEHHALGEPGSNAVASLNTHDMPPFASFWRGLDIEDRLDLGLISEDSARDERAHRDRLRQSLVRFLRHRGLLPTQDEDMESVMEACVAYLGRGQAEVVLVNLEDLWGETLPQNTPGTVEQRVNWRRKARLTFEEFTASPRVDQVLSRLAATRP